jgi:hypothetical protein
MKTFNDLEFREQRQCSDSFQALLELGNGLTISVVHGPGKYSNAEKDEYEVAVFFGNDFVPLQVYDDVIGWQRSDEITSLMKEAQEDEDFVRSRIDRKEEHRREMDL